MVDTRYSEGVMKFSHLHFSQESLELASSMAADSEASDGNCLHKVQYLQHLVGQDRSS